MVAETRAYKRKEEADYRAAVEASLLETQPRTKKPRMKYTNKYGIKLGHSRYGPEIGPQKEEVVRIFNILRDHHTKDGLNLEPDRLLWDASRGGPMHASNACTVHAFVSTILSQSTGNRGALSVQWELRYHFPFNVNGQKVMGRIPNYHDMRKADISSLIEILRPSGLQYKRAKMIKSILNAVYDMNVSAGTVSVSNILPDNAKILESFFHDNEIDHPVPPCTETEAGGSFLVPSSEEPSLASNTSSASYNLNISIEAEPHATETNNLLSSNEAAPSSPEVKLCTAALTPDFGPIEQSTNLESSSPIHPGSIDILAVAELDQANKQATKPLDFNWAAPASWVKRGHGVWEPPEEKCPDFFVSGSLSIDHLNSLGNQEVFDELTSHEGIGVKTAFCIMLFNLHRPVFAVDIHVFRLCKFLGWSPEGLREDRTAEMLDPIVPDDLKLPLHQAFWHHGQLCGRCRSGATENSVSWKAECPIEDFVDRKRFVPDQSKAQKERNAAKAAIKAEKEAEKAVQKQQAEIKKGTRRQTSSKAPKLSPKSSLTQTIIKFESTEMKIKRDVEDTQLEPVQQSRTKKPKLEEPDERDPAEWAKIRVHDDFDAGRNQNVTKTIWVKIRKVELKWEKSN